MGWRRQPHHRWRHKPRREVAQCWSHPVWPERVLASRTTCTNTGDKDSCVQPRRLLPRSAGGRVSAGSGRFRPRACGVPTQRGSLSDFLLAQVRAGRRRRRRAFPCRGAHGDRRNHRHGRDDRDAGGPAERDGGRAGGRRARHPGRRAGRRRRRAGRGHAHAAAGGRAARRGQGRGGGGRRGDGGGRRRRGPGRRAPPRDVRRLWAQPDCGRALQVRRAGRLRPVRALRGQGRRLQVPVPEDQETFPGSGSADHGAEVGGGRGHGGRRCAGGGRPAAGGTPGERAGHLGRPPPRRPPLAARPPLRRRPAPGWRRRRQLASGRLARPPSRKGPRCGRAAGPGACPSAGRGGGLPRRSGGGCRGPGGRACRCC
mmetsp:Transcript_27045/g.44644  ORF Transcript_27045/g.44644 Transcript_27045/m.44644 type:complete len:371 (+) Transcript_27045:602-1714(+)